MYRGLAVADLHYQHQTADPGRRGRNHKEARSIHCVCTKVVEMDAAALVVTHERLAADKL